MLLSLREEQNPKLLTVCVGILLNCCYKSQSNKLEVYNTQGIPDIVSLLGKSPSVEISVQLLSKYHKIVNKNLFSLYNPLENIRYIKAIHLHLMQIFKKIDLEIHFIRYLKFIYSKNWFRKMI